MVGLGVVVEDLLLAWLGAMLLDHAGLVLGSLGFRTYYLYSPGEFEGILIL